MFSQLKLGANYLGNGQCSFYVWAPKVEDVAVHIIEPRKKIVPLKRKTKGYHYGVVQQIEPGTLYFYLLDGQKERPDPASRFQPYGVHGPSQVVDSSSFIWTDHGWSGLALKDLIFYELHVGTYTPEGNFDALGRFLGEFQELGITALELMPVAQFPGERNWGYDGVYPYAVQNSYGGPQGLKRLVDHCHQQGLSVFLDVVYNHLGPEGNYFEDYGFYFTDRYHTPWGRALNFDGPGSDEVRRFFIENAFFWLTEFHIDGLRLDAVHAIIDKSARHFLEELAFAVKRLAGRWRRKFYLIAESDLNNPRLIQPRFFGGYGLDAQWSDDFHHALHALLTGERNGYYQDFGRLEHLARAYREGYTYTGEYSSYRQRRHGRRPEFCQASQFVVYIQNHDQVGNRAQGERLGQLVSFDAVKLAAGVVILSPFLPLLFMGEEYGETSPFQYFTSFSDQSLAKDTYSGRQKEIATFGWREETPDPQAQTTFFRSRLNREHCYGDQNLVLRSYYRELIKLRREITFLSGFVGSKKMTVIAYEKEKVLFIQAGNVKGEVCQILSFSHEKVEISLPVPSGDWLKQLDAAEIRWMGGGSTVPARLVSPGKVQLVLSPYACILFARSKEE